MAGLVYIISLIYVAVINTAGLDFTQEADLFLETALKINKWLFLLTLSVTLAVFLIGLITTFIFIAAGSKKFIWDKLSFGLSCSGCITLSIIFLPLVQGLVYWANYLMASSFDSTGITDPFKFWLGLILTVLMIWG